MQSQRFIIKTGRIPSSGLLYLWPDDDTVSKENDNEKQKARGQQNSTARYQQITPIKRNRDRLLDEIPEKEYWETRGSYSGCAGQKLAYAKPPTFTIAIKCKNNVF